MELRGRKIPRAKDKTATAALHEVPRSNGVPPAPPPPLPSLSPISRLYLYALHGCMCELVFTSVWNFFSTQDVRLQGHSSLWALPMYSAALLILERVGQKLSSRNIPLPLRLAVYICFIYLWEFTCGAGLSLLGACPWDYSGFRYNVKGLITLEYAPFWAVGGLLAEKFVIKNALRIRMQ